MAETIVIPSPSAFLASPTLQTPKSLPKSSARRSSTAAKPSTMAESAAANGVTKRKQSKSRNGCITCKAKRLKCDETKPTCQQCARRSVVCGGYKKDFKWRPFEEASFTGKPPTPKQRKPSLVPLVQSTILEAPNSPAISDTSNITIGPPSTLPEGLIAMPPTVMQQHDFSMNLAYQPVSPLYPSPAQEAAPFLGLQEPIAFDVSDSFEPKSAPSSISLFDDADTFRSATTAPSSLSSGHSPRLADLIVPAPDLHTSPDLHTAPAEYLPWRPPFPEHGYQPIEFDPLIGVVDPVLDPMEEDTVEEIVREPMQLNPDHEAWVMRLPSPSPSSSSGSSNGSTVFSSFLREPIFDAGSPEMLTRRFDRETCGVLSVKDGPTENPWRTLVWPLARDCPALYHAIASMTCFHSSRNQPSLRILGIDHMRTAIHALATGIQNMRFDAAIATTLVLAFSESWDQHTSTGINHIKGAKILVNQALVRQRNNPSIPKEEADRIRFLCNTWIYMDVIARLTSCDEDESDDFGVVSAMLTGPQEAEIHLDPLMGCASSLFPIIGRVANLVRRVCRSESNSPAVISQAMELKNQLEAWAPPAFFEAPEDPTSPVVHSLQTAEAYRWATLLYLHQAVPEIPSLSSAELAKKVMVYLATVPPSSRAIIVQIYPLTAAGCEAVDEEDRDWVLKRWQSMAQRMALGIIDRCAEVTKEVWDRRDAWEAEKARLTRRSSSVSTPSLKRELSFDDADPYGWMETGINFGSKKRALSGLMGDIPISKAIKSEKRPKGEVGSETLDPELTVRGRLHWVGVMKDWQWEVLLG